MESCNISTATVSRALSGNRYVNDSLKKIILDTASQMGYVVISSPLSAETLMP